MTCMLPQCNVVCVLMNSKSKARVQQLMLFQACTAFRIHVKVRHCCEVALVVQLCGEAQAHLHCSLMPQNKLTSTYRRKTQMPVIAASMRQFCHHM